MYRFLIDIFVEHALNNTFCRSFPKQKAIPKNNVPSLAKVTVYCLQFDCVKPLLAIGDHAWHLHCGRIWLDNHMFELYISAQYTEIKVICSGSINPCDCIVVSR